MDTPKDKALYIMRLFLHADHPNIEIGLAGAKVCAAIAVDEILQLLKRTENENIPIYWLKVKKEINKL